jgi:hypothetical protein
MIRQIHLTARYRSTIGARKIGRVSSKIQAKLNGCSRSARMLVVSVCTNVRTERSPIAGLTGKRRT